MYIFNSDLVLRLHAINDYLRLKIRVVCVGNFQPLMVIVLVIPNQSWIYLCSPEIFKINV